MSTRPRPDASLSGSEVNDVVLSLLAEGETPPPAPAGDAEHATRIVTLPSKVPVSAGRSSTAQTWFAWACSCGIDTTDSGQSSSSRHTAERKAQRHVDEATGGDAGEPTGRVPTLRWFQKTAVATRPLTTAETEELAWVDAVLEILHDRPEAALDDVVVDRVIADLMDEYDQLSLFPTT